MTQTLTQYDIYDNYFESEYCNSVLECADYEGNLSEGNVMKLLHDHSASYHEFIEEKLKGSGVLVSAEEEVTWDEPRIVGHYDAIIERTTDKKHILLEIKSMAEPKNKKYLQYLPKHEHLMQWNLYSMMTGLDEGIIFYINKNSQEYMIFPVERNDDIIENILKKLKKIKGYLDLDEEKIIPYLPDENHAWCNFQMTCERDHFIKGI